jgi:hypothetical protein
MIALDGDAFFIDEALRELTALGAVEADAAGRPRLTDLGRTCYSMGHLPSQPRKLQASIFFDPLAGDFPDDTVLPEGHQAWLDRPSAPALDPVFTQADPQRIPVDTIREALARQGLLPSDGCSLVCVAEPAECGDRTASAEGPSDEDQTQVQDGIRWRELCLLVFLNGEGQVRLNAYDPHLRSSPTWFRRVLDSRLSDGLLDWAHVLGALADPAISTHAGTSVRLQHELAEAALEPVPALAVQKEVLDAVAQSKGRLFLHCRSLPDTAAGSLLCQAIRRAARRGVRCQVSWDVARIGDLADAAKLIGLHDNIEHRASETLAQEMLWTDQPVAMGSCLCRIGPQVRYAVVLKVGRSVDATVCQTVANASAQVWQENQDHCSEDLTASSPALSSDASGQSFSGQAAQYCPVLISQSTKEASR